MSFTSAAMHSVNDYIKDIALESYRFLGMRYEPSLIFDRQLRAVVSESAGDFAKKFGNSKWILVGYSRDKLEFQLKRCDVFYEQIGDLYKAKMKRREVHCNFNYIFISPSTELLEDVEEKIIVRDMGYSLYPTAEVIVYGSDKEELYRYPFEFLVNLVRFESQNFGHLDDTNNGVFSIFQISAVVNFPVFTIEEVSDMTGTVCEEIHLEITSPAHEETIIIPSGD